MEVWIVFSDHTTYVTTENCYDEDGYYDDYWEEEYHETEVICVCATEELAKKKTEECEINDTCGFTTFYYGLFEVLEESEIDRGLDKELTIPTNEQLEHSEKRLEQAKKVFKE